MTPMRWLALLTAWLLLAPARVRGAERERGDIPGWVMIAIMSAAVVVVLIPVVSGAVRDAFTNAIQNVTNTSGN